MNFHEVLNQFFFIQMWSMSLPHNLFLIGGHANFKSPPCKNNGPSLGSQYVYLLFPYSQQPKKIAYRLHGLPTMTAIVTFLRWTLSNHVFCLIKAIEELFTRVVKIACFVRSFTSNKDCTTLNNSSL